MDSDGTIMLRFYVGLLAVILIFGVGMYYEGAISHASPYTVDVDEKSSCFMSDLLMISVVAH